MTHRPHEDYEIVPQNGLGTAALLLGVLGVVFGLLPILFWLTFVLGVLAVTFGLLGRARAKRGRATNKGMATGGVVLGIIGLILAVSTAVILANIFESVYG